jgi:hypothetical protein
MTSESDQDMTTGSDRVDVGLDQAWTVGNIWVKSGKANVLSIDRRFGTQPGASSWQDSLTRDCGQLRQSG